MAVGDYVGKSQFWTKLKVAVGAQLITAKMLYEEGIERCFDRGAWVYDQLVALGRALAAQTRGTYALKQGAIDLSTLTFAEIGGDLNGKTLTVQADTGGPKTVTFGTGVGLAPLTPADVVSQANAAWGGQPIASLDSGNKLMISSATSGGTSTITVTAGSAVLLLGLTVGAGVAGQATGNSGSELIGVPEIAGDGGAFTFPAGTLYDALVKVADLYVLIPRLDSALNEFLHDMTIDGDLVVQGEFAAQGLAGFGGAVTCTHNVTTSGAHTCTFNSDAIIISGAQCAITSPELAITAGTSFTVSAPVTNYTGQLKRTGASAIEVERAALNVADNNAAPTITMAYETVAVDGPTVDQVWLLPAAPSYTTTMTLCGYGLSTHKVDIQRASLPGTNFARLASGGSFGTVIVKSLNVNGTWNWRIVGTTGTGTEVGSGA